MRILIVEDEKAIADVLASRLRKEKYSVDVSYDGEEGCYNALTDIYNLIILDVMLPYKDGFQILREIKENNISAKVIMLTARSDISDKLTGLEGGADDYVTKPFHIDEVVARVNIQLRKKINKEQNTIDFKDISLNLKSSVLYCTTGESIEVSLKELLLLEYLIQNSSIIVSKEQIYDKVWGPYNEIESNNLEAYLSFIRKKLKLIGSKVTIKAIRGIGYRLGANNE